MREYQFNELSPEISGAYCLLPISGRDGDILKLPTLGCETHCVISFSSFSLTLSKPTFGNRFVNSLQLGSFE